MSTVSSIAIVVFGTWLILFLAVALLPSRFLNPFLARWIQFSILSRWEMFVAKPHAEQSVAWLVKARRLEKGGSLSNWEEVFCSVEPWKAWHFLWHPRGILHHQLHRCCGHLGKQLNRSDLERTESFFRLLSLAKQTCPGANGYQIQLLKRPNGHAEEIVIWESKMQIERES